MRYFLIYMKRVHAGQIDPELRVKEFEDKLEMLEFAAGNQVTQRGVRYYAAIEGEKILFGGETGIGGLGDIYDEIERMKRAEAEKVRVNEEVISGLS